MANFNIGQRTLASGLHALAGIPLTKSQGSSETITTTASAQSSNLVGSVNDGTIWDCVCDGPLWVIFGAPGATASIGGAGCFYYAAGERIQQEPTTEGEIVSFIDG